MKKICHIVTNLELGGAQKIVLQIVKGINSSKYESILICGKGGLLHNSNNFNFKIKIFSSLVRNVNPIYDLVTIFQLTRFLKQEKPDIVHTHTSKAGILGRWAAYFAGVKNIIHTYHGFSFHDYISPIKKRIYIFLEKITNYITWKNIYICEANIKKAITSGIYFPDKTILIANGIDFSQFNINESKNELKKLWGLPENKKIIGMIACLKEQKYPFDFLKAAGYLHKKHDNELFFVLIGDGVLKSKLEKQIIEENLINHFKLTGWIENIEKILPVIDIFVLTSLWEGLPLSIVEAMYLGIPVVVTEADGNKDIVEQGKNGFLFKPHDIDDLTKYINILLDNKDLYKKISKNNKEKIDNNFSIENMIKKIENLYEQISKIFFHL